MNPLKQNTKNVNDYFFSFEKMYPKPYSKKTTAPYDKCWVILLNGLEFESSNFMHQLSRNTLNNDIRREVAVIRKQEQMQQKRISCLKPINENILETTVAYEQLAIDLTATLAKHDKDKNDVKALNFALLEDFDHLYRFSNLLMYDKGEDASTLVGKFTEITPARPTVAHHRYPMDEIKKPMNAKTSDIYSKLVANIITAAEQQTMNFYMNIAQWYKNDLGRKLYAEIGMVEEEHVSQYESLKDPTCTFLEQFVMHEFTECYLYFSASNAVKDKNLKSIFCEHFEMECAHLKKATELLEKYEKKSYQSVIGSGEFPELLVLGENKEYIRKVLEDTVLLTADRESYVSILKLKQNSEFFAVQKSLMPDALKTPSHEVIESTIRRFGKDYRYEDKPNPVKELQSRKKDNVNIGRRA